MNLDTMTITELKALAYDTLATIEVQQSNLRIINQEIGKRPTATSLPQEAVPVTETPKEI